MVKIDEAITEVIAIANRVMAINNQSFLDDQKFRSALEHYFNTIDLGSIVCIYCGYKTDSIEEINKHIRECKNRPEEKLISVLKVFAEFVMAIQEASIELANTKEYQLLTEVGKDLNGQEANTGPQSP